MIALTHTCNNNNLTVFSFDKIVPSYQKDLFASCLKQINSFSYKQNISWGFWPLSFVEDNISFLESILSKTETKSLQNFKSYKRKLQFVGARALAKIIISNNIPNSFYNFSSINHKHISINKGDNGAPYIFINNRKYNNLFISISHDQAFLLVAIAKYPIGVDIQPFSHKLLDIKNYFISQNEDYIISKYKEAINKEAINKEQSLLELHKHLVGLVWTSKEAIAKLFNKSIFYTRKYVSLKNIENNVLSFDYLIAKHPPLSYKTISSYNFLFDKHLISIALNRKHNSFIS